MRLSDIQGERVFDVIADIIDPIANIAEDDAASALFKREKLPEGMTAKEFMTQRARKALPALLKGHKGDIIAILASIEGVSVESYTGALNLVKSENRGVPHLCDRRAARGCGKYGQICERELHQGAIRGHY